MNMADLAQYEKYFDGVVDYACETPTSKGRRVIFPSLYMDSPSLSSIKAPSSPVPLMPLIPEDAEPQASATAKILPQVDEDYLMSARFQLSHMLALSPLKQSSDSVAEQNSLKHLLLHPLCPLTETEGLIKTQPIPKVLEVPRRGPSKPKTHTPASFAKLTELHIEPAVPSVERAVKSRVPQHVTTAVASVKKAAELQKLPRSILPVRSTPFLRIDMDLSEVPEQHSALVGDDSEQSSKIASPILRRSKSLFTRKPSPPGSPEPNVKNCAEVGKVSSVESDIPSLASSVLSDDDTAVEAQQHQVSPRQRSYTRRKAISFDPCIWVREYERTPEECESIWYSPEELTFFKQEAVQRIMAYSEIIPTGTGRTMVRRPKPCKALFSHKALQMDSVMDAVPSSSAEIIQRILLVDPRDVCLKLFAKSFQGALPGVSITSAHSAEEALRDASTIQFDIILVEERLGKNSSGSTLLSDFGISHPKSLLIGVSAYLSEDASRLQRQSDVVWGKPPPFMDADVMDNLRNKLSAKRIQT